MLCGPRKNITESLSGKYKERVVGRGLTEGGMILELFVSSKGSWSVVVNDPLKACIISTGEAWEKAEPSIGEKAGG
jgi:hypothetical protein